MCVDTGEFYVFCQHSLPHTDTHTTKVIPMRLLADDTKTEYYIAKGIKSFLFIQKWDSF